MTGTLTALRWRSDDRRPVAAQLAGTGRLADDLYLMAHHDVTGRPLPAAAGGRPRAGRARCWPS